MSGRELCAWLGGRTGAGRTDATTREEDDPNEEPDEDAVAKRGNSWTRTWPESFPLPSLPYAPTATRVPSLDRLTLYPL